MEIKQTFDIDCPIDTIISLDTAQALRLYITLIAGIAELNNTSKSTNEQYDISIEKEMLMDICQYTGSKDDFMEEALQPAIKSVNKFSEISVKNEQPELTSEG